LKLTLVCDGNSKDIFNGPAIENIVVPLTPAWTGDLNGDCYFEADYNSEIKKQILYLRFQMNLVLVLI